MISVTYFIIILFLLTAVTVYKGFNHQLSRKYTTTTKPKLSLVIAAKNEETNINSLIDSIEQLNYPKENLEIIIVDDSSTDKTTELIQSKIKDKIHFKLITANNKTILGKKGALAIGIEAAQNNFIAITDADCVPKAYWLNAIAGKLDEGFDFVFSVAPIESGKTLVEKISAFENLRNTYLTIAAVGLNIPYSAAARSFAFRKTSFNRIGGYSNTTETISGDDDLLLREAVKNKMLIGTIIEPDAFVFSAAPIIFANYFKQKKRHLQTSFYYLAKQKMFLGFWHLINLVSLLSVWLFLISPILAMPFAVKLIYDFFVVIKYQKKLGHHFNFHEIIYLQILFEVFIVVNFFNSLSGKTEWK
ncbi:MAG: glycosyltransferase [Ignavibacteriales bacterium]|nr:glycosyltransferase [Ignavibacteriales bacterium]